MDDRGGQAVTEKILSIRWCCHQSILRIFWFLFIIFSCKHVENILFILCLYLLLNIYCFKYIHLPNYSPFLQSKKNYSSFLPFLRWKRGWTYDDKKYMFHKIYFRVVCTLHVSIYGNVRKAKKWRLLNIICQIPIFIIHDTTFLHLSYIYFPNEKAIIRN